MLVLHVGPHKTATTWIQSNLHHNAARLRQSGWLYPQTGERVSIAHHDLSDDPEATLRPDGRLAAELRKIGEQARADGLNIILSAEGFRHWRQPQIKKLQDLVGQTDLHIVYCLRDPVSLLSSFWAQQVKSGLTLSLPRFVRGQQRYKFKLRLLDPRREIASFARIRPARFTLLTYDEIKRGSADIFDVFAERILEIKDLPHIDNASVNEREPLELTEFMRLLSKRGGWKRKNNLSVGLLFRFMVTERERQRIISTVAAVPDARRSFTIERATSRLMRIEKAILRRFRRLMVPMPGGESLFLREAAQVEYLDEATLLASPDVVRLLDRMASRLGPGSVRRFVAGWSRFWMIAGRRFLKLFR